jgi:hypothetical protein
MQISLHPLTFGSWLSEVGLPSASLMRSHQSKKTASPFQQNNCVVWAADLIQDAYKKQMVFMFRFDEGRNS